MTLRDLLQDGRVHVVDGAMGTMLYARGIFLNVCYDELNLRQPDVIRDIHRDYIRAGAELIETNTFGANPRKLASSVVGNLVRAGRLRRDGDDVILVEDEGRQRADGTDL